MPEQMNRHFSQESLPEWRTAERVERMPLKPHKQTEVDTVHVMADAAFIEEQIGVDGALVASLRAGDTDFLLIDTRDSRKYFSPFLVISDDYYYGAPDGWKAVYANQPVRLVARIIRAAFRLIK